VLWFVFCFVVACWSVGCACFVFMHYDNERRIFRTIDELWKWATRWRIKFNVRKSVAVYFTPKRRLSAPNLTLGGEPIPFSPTARYQWIDIGYIYSLKIPRHHLRPEAHLGEPHQAYHKQRYSSTCNELLLLLCYVMLAVWGKCKQLE